MILFLPNSQDPRIMNPRLFLKLITLAVLLTCGGARASNALPSPAKTPVAKTTTVVAIFQALPGSKIG